MALLSVRKGWTVGVGMPGQKNLTTAILETLTGIVANGPRTETVAATLEAAPIPPLEGGPGTAGNTAHARMG